MNRPVRNSRPSRWRWPVAAAVIVAAAGLVFALAHLATGRGPEVNANTGDATTRISVDRAGGSGVGDPGPAFTVTTTTGAEVRVPSGKPAVLFFMAAWCRPVGEASALDAIAKQYRAKVTVVGVGMDPSESFTDLRAFAAGYDRYGYVQDGDGSLSRALGVRALDSTVVLDANGRIVWRDAVATDQATLLAALAKAGLGGAS